MAVTISGGEISRLGSFHSVDSLTGSTSTGAQTVSVDDPVTAISGSTATGFDKNRALLATGSAVEGQIKTVVMTGTGEMYLIFSGTATGALVLSDNNDHATLRFQNGVWMQIAHTATLATATGTA